MNFKSRILENTQIFKGEISGEYLFNIIGKRIEIEYQFINKLNFTKKIFNQDLAFLQLEEQFLKFLDFFNVNRYNDFTDSICKILYEEAFKDWSLNTKIAEKNRLLNDIYLSRIILSSTIRDEILHNKVNILKNKEIVLFYIDEKTIIEHSITVEIDFENFRIKTAFFE